MPVGVTGLSKCVEFTGCPSGSGEQRGLQNSENCTCLKLLLSSQLLQSEIKGHITARSSYFYKRGQKESYSCEISWFLKY